jgi:molybdenum cofactor cytidylyltransferase
MPGFGIVILAAGGSSRLGFAKQLVQVDGVSLLRRITDEAMASSCKPIVVVLGARAAELRSEIEGLPVVVAVNADWQTGMGSSIRCGITALRKSEPALEGVLIALCDQPRIGRALFDRLVDARMRSNKLICAAKYANAIGTPALFSSSLFAELEELPDADGGREVIRRYPLDTEPVEMPEAEIDLDTPADLARFQVETQRKSVRE